MGHDLSYLIEALHVVFFNSKSIGAFLETLVNSKSYQSISCDVFRSLTLVCDVGHLSLKCHSTIRCNLHCKFVVVLAWVGSASEVRCQRFGLNLTTEDRTTVKLRAPKNLFHLKFHVEFGFGMQGKLKCGHNHSHKQVGSSEVSDLTDNVNQMSFVCQSTPFCLEIF